MPNRFKRIVPAALATTAFAAAALQGQFGGGAPGDWPTFRMNAQRTGWMQTDPYISREVMAKPVGFDLQWKLTLDGGGRARGTLSSGVAVGGRVPLTWVADRSNIVHAIDTDTGVLYWSKKLEVATTPAPADGCAGGLTAGVTRASTALVPPSGVAPRGNGFGASVRPAPRGTIGQPGQGVPAEFLGRAAALPPVAPTAEDRGRAAAPAPVTAASGRAAAAGGGGRAGVGGGRAGGGGAFTIASDGVVHVLGDQSGIEVQQPTPFLPANAKAAGFIGVGGVLYAATSEGCAGVPNAIWALDWNSEAKTVTSWTSGGSPVGAPAFDSAGTIFVAVGPTQSAATGLSSAIVALEQKTLVQKDWFSQPGADFAASPTIVKFQDRELVAATTRDGRIFLLDPASLGGSDHETPLYVSSAFSSTQTSFTPSGITFWQDADNTAWLLVPIAGRPAGLTVPDANGAVTNGAILALKLVAEEGKPSLRPAWTSTDMTTPWAPVVVNGVVFALSSGEYRPAHARAASLTTAQRSARSVPAILYALDGATGRSLWNSGKKMPVHAPDGALWAANSQILVAGADNAVYAFGFGVAKW